LFAYSVVNYLIKENSAKEQQIRLINL